MHKRQNIWITHIPLKFLHFDFHFLTNVSSEDIILKELNLSLIIHLERIV